MIADLVQGNTAACSRGKQGGVSRHPYPRPLGCLSYPIKEKNLLKRSEYLNLTDASQAAVCQSLVNVSLLSNFVHSELYPEPFQLFLQIVTFSLLQILVLSTLE